MAWAVALIVTVTFLSPAACLRELLVLITLFAAVNVPSISLWAAAGYGVRGFLAKGRRIAVFNLIMAALLVASMVLALF